MKRLVAPTLAALILACSSTPKSTIQNTPQVNQSEEKFQAAPGIQLEERYREWHKAVKTGEIAFTYQFDVPYRVHFVNVYLEDESFKLPSQKKGLDNTIVCHDLLTDEKGTPLSIDSAANLREGDIVRDKETGRKHEVFFVMPYAVHPEGAASEADPKIPYSCLNRPSSWK